MPYFHKKKKKRKGLYKSGLEEKFAALAEAKGLEFAYELDTFTYVVPTHYTPDFRIAENRFIETKGYLSPSNRQRLICFKEQHPKIEICLLFGNADNKLNSKSKTTYREWAEKHGFLCADIRDGLPVKWWKNKNENNKNRKDKRPRRTGSIIRSD